MYKLTRHAIVVQLISICLEVLFHARDVCVRDVLLAQKLESIRTSEPQQRTSTPKQTAGSISKLSLI